MSTAITPDEAEHILDQPTLSQADDDWQAAAEVLDRAGQLATVDRFA